MSAVNKITSQALDGGSTEPDSAAYVGSVVVQFSAGRGSFAAAHRAVERYGSNRVRALFCDTTVEDADCYRFLVEGAEALGIRLDVAADGRNPWDLADDEHMIPNSRVPTCSRVLKHEPAARWLDEHTPDALVVSGIGPWEAHREEGIRAGHLPRATWFPLLEPPWLDEDALLDLIRSYGIEPPRMYAAGYPHANCAGGCFRAGHAAWRLLLRDSPDLFAWHEWREHNFRRRRGVFASILRWRSGPLDGQPMTLTTFRRLVESGNEGQLDLFDYGGCGCTPGDAGGVLISTIGLREAS